MSTHMSQVCKSSEAITIYQPTVKMFTLKLLGRCSCCNKLFIIKHKRHVYCCRKCFKKDYKIRMETESFPVFMCPSCGTETTLDFMPKKNTKEWYDFSCPKCGFEPISLDIKEKECD